MGICEKAKEWKEAQPNDYDYDYEVCYGTFRELTGLDNAVWVIMERGNGNINLGNNSKYANAKKLEYEVEDDECSAEGGVSLAYVRKVKKAKKAKA